MSNNIIAEYSRVVMTVGVILAVASVLVGVIALAVALIALTPDTELVASITFLSPDVAASLEGEYWNNGVVPLCTDLPPPEFDTEVEAVACLLKVVK